MNKKLWFITALLFTSVFVACKNTENKTATAGTDSTTAVQDTLRKTVYACPMDPEVSSNEPGKCPKCGMDLEITNR